MSTRIRTLKDVEGNVFYPLTSGIAVAHGPVVDITDITSGGTYTSLSIALSAVPVNYQKGGMTLRYVDGNSGKYVEWFNTNSDWTTNLGSWIKVYNDGIFDVSANNIIDGQPSTFSSLGEILTNVDTLIPISARKGGMCIKFIQSPDNKYVQCRYMSSSIAVADFTNVYNWQGVDDTPILGSNNLVRSGGVFKGFKYTLSDTTLSNIHIDNNGRSHWDLSRVSTISFIQKKIKITVNTGSTFKVRLYTFNTDSTLIDSGRYTYSIEISNLSYLYKIAFKKQDESEISPSDVIQNITVSYPTEDKIFYDISLLKQNVGDGLVEENISSKLESGYIVTRVGAPIGNVVSHSTRKHLLISNLENYKKFYIKATGGSSGAAFAKVSNGIVTEIGWGDFSSAAEIAVDGTFDEILFNVNTAQEYEIKAWKSNSIVDRVNRLESPLKDKNIVILGDSSVAASNWAQRMCIDLNFNDYYIVAVGGSTITTKITDGVLGNCLRKSIENAINHIDNTWEGKVDLIMMQIGGNDIGYITGSIEDAFSNTNYLYYKDDTTTWGSARYCYELLKRKYPAALITAGTVFGRIGSNWDGNAGTINTLIKEMAQRFCLQVIDGNSYCGFAPILEPISPYYNDGTPGVANNRTNLSRNNPTYNYVDSNNNIVTYAEATIDGVLKEGYSKRYGLYTYDGKHQNLQGEEKVMKFMSQEVRKLLFK